MTSLVGGPPQRIEERFENSHLTTVVEAEAWADGPTGYVIKGWVQAQPADGSEHGKEGTFGHKGASGSWSYETGSLSAKHFLVHGTRKSGEDLTLVLGNQGGNFSRWIYGDEITRKLPETF
ncbi:hypothetical protein GTW71_21920 [Streptomyces sp. SID6041]|nr:hypothetical protein [Streptomyces sp. SID6041]